MLPKPEILLRWTLGGAFVVLLLKTLAYAVGGSAGFFSDAGESLINVLTALLGLYGIQWTRRPRDREHPYGHGKGDALVGALQAIIVMATAAGLAFTILTGGYIPAQSHAVREVFFLQGGAMSLNLGLAFLLWRNGRRYSSTILRAESLHLLGDVATSFVVLLNFLGLRWGLPEIVDKSVGLGVVIIVGYGSLRILRETTATLMDTQDPRLLERLAAALQAHRRPEWIDLHNVRIQRYGRALHVDGHVTLPWYWSLEKAHEAMKTLEEVLRGELDTEVEFFWHMDPCEPICCSFCEIQDCPYRQAVFEKRRTVTPESLFVNQKGWQPDSAH
ncbi:MAG: cation diffusion facilitator family transporter [Bacteroidia bacterium]|nr:cation diffusion facilitator family transporter [Bacteroidia bacterium]